MPSVTIPHALIIAGPTGVGKTALSLKVGQSFGCEILNADVGQFYCPLTIGTAKPDWRVQPVAHHLFDVVNEPIDLNIATFRSLAHETMTAITQRQRIPLVVGGSGFYVQGLIQKPCAHTQTPKRTYEQSTQALWQELAAVDPQRAGDITKTDRYRITRALDIWYGLGRMPSQCAPTFAPLAQKTLIVLLTRPLDELYQRINERVLTMMHEGWLEEVSQLDESWCAFLLRKKLIGYDDLIHYMSGNVPLPEVIAGIQQKTRNYAKRQMTFFRRLARICQPHETRVTVLWHEICDENVDPVVAYIKEWKEWYESR